MNDQAQPVERDYYSIEEHDGQKTLHYHGWIERYEGIAEEDLWSNVELTGCLVPLARVVGVMPEDRIGALRDWAAETKQYQMEITADTALILQQSYYGAGLSGEQLQPCDLALNTPCGRYWFDEGEQHVDDRAVIRAAWNGGGVYELQYNYDGPIKIHASTLDELLNGHNWWVGNDAEDLYITSVTYLRPDGLTTDEIVRSLEEFTKDMSGWQGLDAESAVECFARHLCRPKAS